MRLQPGRRDSMVEIAVARDSCIICHDTDGETAVVCRGFYNHHKTVPLQIAQRLKRIQLVSPVKLPEEKHKTS